MHPADKRTGDTNGADKVSETKLDNSERSAQGLRSEAARNMDDLTDDVKQQRQAQKALRGERLSSQFRDTGKALVGVITRQFGCSIELTNAKKGRVEVPGRSAEDIAKLDELQNAAKSHMLIGDGGKAVAGSPQDHQQLYDEKTGEIKIGKHTYGREQIVSELPAGLRSDATSSDKHPFDDRNEINRKEYPDGTSYVIRQDRSIDKFVNREYQGTATKQDGTPFRYDDSTGFPRMLSDIKQFNGTPVEFKNDSIPAQPGQHQILKGSVEHQDNSNSRSGTADSGRSDRADTDKQSHPLKGGVEQTDRTMPEGKMEQRTTISSDRAKEEQRTSDQAESFYNFTLMVNTKRAQGSDTEQLINISINNNLKIDGKDINDGQPHRHLFPLKNDGNTLWRYMDATVQVSPDKKSAEMQIHRMTYSSTPEDNSGAWTSLNEKIQLQQESTKRNVSISDYQNYKRDTGSERGSQQSWTASDKHKSIEVKLKTHEY